MYHYVKARIDTASCYKGYYNQDELLFKLKPACTLVKLFVLYGSLHKENFR